MGAGLSISVNPSTPTQTSDSSSSNMSSNPPNPDPKSLENQNPDPKITEIPNPETDSQPGNPDETGRIPEEESKKGTEGEGEGEEEEEEGECGFCLFMKAGGCKDEFIAWEQCVEESEKNQEDIVEKCMEVTGNLKKCMLAHSDYYEPLLAAEKAAEEEVKQGLEAEAAAAEDEQSSKPAEESAEIEVETKG